ncbi:hypothetical protein EVAR_36111_1 [Eumeta japonica]|uniref:Uncharacterized protein n=1 Tax=Eumeta variegata TaxID=151549 RepID=A0A4C1X507_EUMVA|nr:hypothetical protein EVAR_36111_1 [Eumeta japonica]
MFQYSRLSGLGLLCFRRDMSSGLELGAGAAGPHGPGVTPHYDTARHYQKRPTHTAVAPSLTGGGASGSGRAARRAPPPAPRRPRARRSPALVLASTFVAVTRSTLVELYRYL